jgi:parallel beta-helix repeat protein
MTPLIPHSAIYINGNSQFTAANGVSAGNGSATNPYIIENWSIGGFPQYGDIALYSTSAHVVIRNVYLYNTGACSYDVGILFWHVANVVVANSTATGGNDGIFISSSTNVTVTRNSFTHNCTGIEVGPLSDSLISTNLAFTQNNVTDNGNGVYIHYANSVSFSYNDVSSNFQGLELDTSNSRVVNNTASGASPGPDFGILVIGSNNLVQGNHAYSDPLGLAISGSNNRVINNMLFSDQTGLAIGEYGTGSNTTIAQNYLDQDSQYGIVVSQRSAGTNVTMNYVADVAGTGISLSGAINTTISGNWVSSSGTGVGAISSNNTLIYHNNLIQNSIQASASNDLKISWNNTYPVGGNYWSDYKGVDNCSGPGQNVCGQPDGIGDTPYQIDVLDHDYYPLMKPFGPTPKFAVIWPAGSSLTASNISTDGLTLLWTPATGATIYHVYEDASLIASVSTTSFTVTGLTLGATYSFKIEAANGWSSYTSNGPSLTVRVLAQGPYLGYEAFYVGSNLPGGSTVIVSNFTALGQDAVRVRGVNLSGDLGTFSLAGLPLYLNSGEAKTLNMTIQIPSGATAGNHVVTIAVSWQYSSSLNGPWSNATDLTISGNIPVQAPPTPPKSQGTSPGNTSPSSTGPSFDTQYGSDWLVQMVNQYLLPAGATLWILPFLGLVLALRKKTNVPSRFPRFCSSCSTEAEITNRFCSKCGNVLPAIEG